MKEKLTGEVNGEEAPTLSKTKTERVGHPRGSCPASMRHRPGHFQLPRLGLIVHQPTLVPTETYKTIITPNMGIG
jgi:hypothetical protein